MEITCISDLHGHYPELPGGDLLIVAGDLTARDTQQEHEKFLLWLNDQQYSKKIFIAGNHDNFYIDMPPEKVLLIGDYLCDSGTEFEGLKIWGSPWIKRFKGQNPKAMAFTVDTEEELAEKWKLIPDDMDILVTHGPPQGVLDFTTIQDGKLIYGFGAKSMQMEYRRIKPKLHIFGHIHEGYGQDQNSKSRFINASHVNEHYEPVNKPIRVEI